MNLTVLRTFEEFQSLKHEWNSLLTKSASAVPFLRHEYLSAWWKTLGGGEWEHGELFIIIARDKDGALVGIAPFFYTQSLDNESSLMFIGSIEISDYLDFIAPQKDLGNFIGSLFEFLANENGLPWKSLDLYNFLENSPTIQYLEKSAVKRGWTYSQERLQHCPYITLPGDWETYLAGIDKKQRHEIRRKMRRAEEAEIPIRWYIVDSEQDLGSEVDDFLALMAQDDEKQSFLTEEMRSQIHALVHAAFQAGWLQLAFLEIGDTKAAGYLNFDFDDRIWVYNSGLDFGFGQYSPGWVLLGYLLQWANQKGRKVFDFMRGDEEYKYRFGGIDRFVVRSKITR
jgi:CelD/BcsL family acetyltransferase involved in cellulose biosynthesis